MTGEASTLIGYYSDDIYKICQFSKQNDIVRIYKPYWINQMLLSRYLWQTRHQSITFNLTKTCLKFNQHKFDTISLQQASISQVVTFWCLRSFWNNNQSQIYMYMMRYWNPLLLNNCNIYWLLRNMSKAAN